ncbi:transport membrane glycoprotein Sec20 [Fusarium subglutinans]|uniref:Transport membrane glycoprotein Sec20 n=1 Tax=Gibberella subglutinans TaxID=42677 RepID=A0A8H5PBL4_GIBSU|nr:transport membrane glycoprotein Sec20 [Fusarium subglutinans]KAF5593609.1 transport membrane glycoprotein Sec20 [Fusarium subglutinans]
MSFEGLQERLTALQETTTQLKELIDRLATLKFQPGSVPLTTDEESSESGELSAEITSTLRDGEEEHELLQEEVEFLRGAEHDKDRLKESVEQIGKELASCRLSFRKARLSAKHSLAQAQRQEREILLTSFSQPTSETNSLYPDDEKTARPTRHQQNVQKQQSSLTEDDQQNVGASANVTNALRRTHDLIQAELARSEFAHETLTESSAALKQLNESYGSLDAMLASSKDLLGTLLRSQKSDTWYLQTTFYMLACTLGWLLFRRLLYGPMWWIVWLPLRLIFGLGTSAGSAMMHAGSGQGQVKEAGQASKGVPVEGLPDDELPTVKVGTEQQAEVLEEVDKIVNVVREADELGNIPEGDEDNIGNPKKRMWEEPDVVEQQRPRDEL